MPWTQIDLPPSPIASDWILESLRETKDVRTNPNIPMAMQSRKHFTCVRYSITTATWYAEGSTIDQTSETIYYTFNGGADSNSAPSVAGKLWICTDEGTTQERNSPTTTWRQVWESWGDWAEFTPP